MLLILKGFSQRHTQLLSLFAHPFWGCSSFRQSYGYPNTLLISNPVTKPSTSSGSRPLSVALCVPHPTLVLQCLGSGTSHQLIVCSVSREQQVLVLSAQVLSPLFKNIHVSLCYLFSSWSLYFKWFCESSNYFLIWLMVMSSFTWWGQTPSQGTLGVPLTHIVCIQISVLTSVVIQATGEPWGHSTPV